MPAITSRLLERMGYVKLSRYGLALTPQHRIVTQREQILDDGDGGRVVGWLDRDLAAIELVPWQPAARRAVATPLAPVLPQLVIAPANPQDLPQGLPKDPRNLQDVAQPEEPEDEWEWELALARARVAAAEAESAAAALVTTAAPALAPPPARRTRQDTVPPPPVVIDYPVAPVAATPPPLPRAIPRALSPTTIIPVPRLPRVTAGHGQLTPVVSARTVRAAQGTPPPRALPVPPPIRAANEHTHPGIVVPPPLPRIPHLKR